MGAAQVLPQPAQVLDCAGTALVSSALSSSTLPSSPLIRSPRSRRSITLTHGASSFRGGDHKNVTMKIHENFALAAVAVAIVSISVAVSFCPTFVVN